MHRRTITARRPPFRTSYSTSCSPIHLVRAYRLFGCGLERLSSIGSQFGPMTRAFLQLDLVMVLAPASRDGHGLLPRASGLSPGPRSGRPEAARAPRAAVGPAHTTRGRSWGPA